MSYIREFTFDFDVKNDHEPYDSNYKYLQLAKAKRESKSEILMPRRMKLCNGICHMLPISGGFSVSK